MDAIKLTSENTTAELVKVPIPKIEHPREVLVKIAYSGVCGTDLHIIERKFPCRQIILGHEFSGIVIDYGAEVTNLYKGDRVVVDPNNGCYKCRFCRSGKPHFCVNVGFHANLGTKNDGGWAPFCVCSAEQVHKLPFGITLKMAALAEPLSCISHGWDVIEPIHIGQNILVIGAGIIGTLWTCLLHSRGHRKITVAEINSSRRLMLEKLIDDVNCRMIDPQTFKDEVGFDVVIDCTGCCAVIEWGLSVLNYGGKFCIFGVAAPDAKIQVHLPDIILKEFTILSVKINPFSFTKAVALLQILGERYLNYDKLGVKMFNLKEHLEAVKLLKLGSITKAIFQMDE